MQQRLFKGGDREIIIVKVAIPNTPFDYFDYRFESSESNAIPEDLIGCRVLVPFRNKSITGIVTAIATHSECSPEQLKNVIALLDITPILSPVILQLCHWASRYYQASMGEMLTQALPTRLRHGKAAEIKLSKRRTTIEQPLLNINIDNVSMIPPALNAEQLHAVNSILEAREHYQCFLLQGITGSGKTEVYLQAVAPLINAGKQVLILVPEIGLTPQLVGRFQARFQLPIAILHSGLNDSERLQAWLNAHHATSPIIIGTRSAVFTPIPNLGMIIVDEEHDASFKQQEGLRYHGRDIAIMRAQMLQIPIVLGSATPSLETLHNVQLAKYQRLILQHRATNCHQTHIKVVDLRNQKLTHGFSKTLIATIAEHLAQQQQVLVFINRRGYAPVLLCPQCNWIADCKHCDAHLTLHLQQHYLHCHHCGHQQQYPPRCEQCQGTHLVPLGVGTERLEHHLQELFPKAKLLRIDRDTTRKKHELAQKLQMIAHNEANLLVGTQMLAKGHHFPNLTLVAIINADQGFYSQDFRSSERLGQLILQVAGRAGRAEKPGTLMIQTYVPTHPLLNTLLQHGYQAFAQAILQERQQARLPPYTHLALLRCKARHEAQAHEQLLKIKTQLQAAENNALLTIWGPAPAPLAKKAGLHRMQLLISAPHRKLLSQALQTLKARTVSQYGYTVNIDIDPLDLA